MSLPAPLRPDTSLAESDIPQTQDVPWEYLSYGEYMTREYLADALTEGRACPAALVIVLISHLDACQQAAVSSGADAFISKGETPERVAARLRSFAASVRSYLMMPSG